MAPKDGDKVKVHYKGSLDDGKVFDESKAEEPLEFEVGKNQVIPGFEDAIKGMEKGQKKTVKILKDQAYGDPRPEFVKEVPVEAFKGQKLEKDSTVVLKSQDNQVILAKVLDLNEKTVKLDLNHPLAGKDLNFDIELVDVNAEK